MNYNFNDLTGQSFKYLNVLRFVEIRKHKSIFLVQCSCGSPPFEVTGNRLRSGNTKSCGCWKSKHLSEIKTKTCCAVCNQPTNEHCASQRIHKACLGLYTSYMHMHDRCAHNDNYLYKNIQVCCEWNKSNPKGKQNFFKWSILNGYKSGYHLHRHENHVHYSPDNCEWITQHDHAVKHHRDNRLTNEFNKQIVNNMSIKEREEMQKTNVTIVTTFGEGAMASVAILKSIYPDAYVMLANYNKDIRINSIPLGSIVFMVDFSLPIREMQSIATRYDLVWCDHHDSIIKEAAIAGFNPKGIRDSSRSSCLLVWEMMNSNLPIPQALQDIADYSTWKFVTDNNMNPLYLHLALSLCDLSSKDSQLFWNRLFEENNNVYNSLISNGKLINNFVNIQNSVCCNDTVFEAELHGYKCLIANAKIANSFFFKTGLEAKPNYYDFLVTYNWFSTINKYRIAIYQNNPNSLAIDLARKFGGGGGDGVAGAAITKLPFNQGVMSNGNRMLSYNNIYAECDRLEDSSNVVAQYANSGLHIITRSQAFDLLIDGMFLLCMNYPLFKHSVFAEANNLYSHEATLTFVWTNCGQYRVLVRPLTPDRRLIDTIESKLPAMFKCSAELIKRVDIRGEIYFMHYCERLPFKIPFQEENN